MISSEQPDPAVLPDAWRSLPTRERHVADTFVTVTDTLVRDFDAVEMLTVLAERCVGMLDAAAAGVALDDGTGRLSVAAASSERGDVLAVLVESSEHGPSASCLEPRRVVACDDLGSREALGRWPGFTRAARAAGFGAALVVPMRLRAEVIGTLALLRAAAGPLRAEDARLGQALADAATIGLLHERALRHAEVAVSQLRRALDSRVLIEQAKGALADAAGITPDAAFVLLRGYSRRHGRRLTDLAGEVVDRTIDWRTLR